MANAAVNKTEFAEIDRDSLDDSSLLTNPLYGEFARNAVDRYQELELVVSRSGGCRIRLLSLLRVVVELAP